MWRRSVCSIAARSVSARLVSRRSCCGVSTGSAPKPLDHRADRGAELHGLGVEDAAGGDRHAEPEPAVALRVPAEQLGHAERGHRAGRLEGLAVMALGLGADEREAAIVDEVFQPGAATVGAAAMVALDADHRLGDRDQAVGRHEAERGREARVGVGAVVREAEAAAHQHVVAEQGVAVPDLQQAEIVGVQVDRVVRGNRDPDLELPGQVHGTVERLLLVEAGDRLLVQKDLVVGAALRQQLGGEHARVLAQAGVLHVGDRCRRGHQVAHHVAARAERGEQRVVDGGDARASGRISGCRGYWMPWRVVMRSVPLAK